MCFRGKTGVVEELICAFRRNHAVHPLVTAFVRRIWAAAIIAFGLGLTVDWISIIGYALVSTMIGLVSWDAA